ncbi:MULTISPECIES: helix-turn-helix domain-containing protein [Roseobacteraceae]|nr:MULTISPECIES: helix-turn-helix transcriptional regulator [Roseobacteraceae]
MKRKYASIAERLLVVRRRAGLSQADFAERIDISPRAYRNYELAVRDVPVALVIGVHREFDVGFSWLLLGEGADAPQASVAALERALVAVRDFQQERFLEFSTEKEARLIHYISTQAASGRDMSDAEINTFLETAA